MSRQLDSSFWNRLRTKSLKNQTARTSPASRKRRLFLEQMEERNLLATFTWDGGSTADNNWTTPENWFGDVAPSPGDDLSFPQELSTQRPTTILTLTRVSARF